MHNTLALAAAAIMLALLATGCRHGDRPMNGSEVASSAEIVDSAQLDQQHHITPAAPDKLTASSAAPKNDTAVGTDSKEVEDRAATKLAADPKGSSERQALHDRLLFFPSKFPEGDWSPKDLPVEDCHFEADDGVKLHGWYLPHQQARAVVLYAHGNGGNVAQWAEVLRVLHDRLQVSTLLFDYRGYGRSEGVPTIVGARHDIRAARKFLAKRANVPAGEIVLWGRSLGGALVIDLAADEGAKALIVESTFSSLRDVGKIHYPDVLVNWFIGNELNSVESIAKHRGPVLLSHGTRDRTIPLEQGRKLFDAANEPKKFVAVAGAGHNGPMTDDLLQEVEAMLLRVTSSH